MLAPNLVTLEEMRAARAELVDAVASGNMERCGPAMLVLRRWLEQQGIAQDGLKSHPSRGGHRAPSAATLRGRDKYIRRRRRLREWLR